MIYRLSEAADEDVTNIYVDGAHRFGIAQSEIYYAGLRVAFELLAQYPLSAKERTEIEPPARMHPHKAHLIFYRVEDTGILIIRVRHALEDWPAKTDW